MAARCAKAWSTAPDRQTENGTFGDLIETARIRAPPGARGDETRAVEHLHGSHVP